ncbi:MAG TPA: CSLREA domain-containing protein, partial [Pirellulaceae bacterium]
MSMSNHNWSYDGGRSSRTSVRIVSLALMLVSLVLVSRDAFAGYITVNTTIDNTASDDGFCSLREAIAAASLNTAWYGCAAGTSGIDIITLHVPPTMSLNFPILIDNKSDVYIVGDHYPYPTPIFG